MGQVLHGSATTTHAVRASIQRSQASSAQLSQALWDQSQSSAMMLAHRASLGIVIQDLELEYLLGLIQKIVKINKGVVATCG